MEFHGFHALVHDRVPSAVRRMDRIHVGLHACRRCFLHSIFPRHCRHRKLGRKLNFAGIEETLLHLV